MKAYQLVKNISQDTNKNSHQELIVKSTCRKYLLKSSMWMTNKGLLFSSNFDFTTRHSSWFSLTHIIFYFSPRVSYSMGTHFDLWMWDYPFIAQYLPASWFLYWHDLVAIFSLWKLNKESAFIVHKMMTYLNTLWGDLLKTSSTKSSQQCRF